MRFDIAYWLISSLFSRELTKEQRHKLSTLVLDKLDALPLRDIITADEGGRLLVDGSPVDIEMMRLLHAHANAALDNKADALISQQVMRIAIVNGLHKGDTPEKIYFYRAAIWWGQQRDELLKLLAQRGEIDSY